MAWLVDGSGRLVKSGSAVCTAGDIANNATVTINGTGFGTKSRALAPLVRDYGQDGTGVLNAGWTSAKPNGSTPSVSNIQNQPTSFDPAGSAVGAPHPYVQNITAGCHYISSGTEPWLVYLAVTFSRPTFPFVLYASWWEVIDPAWAFSGTFNIKQAAYSYSAGIAGDCIYSGINPAVTDNNTPTTQYTTNQNNIDQSTLENPDRNGKTPTDVGFWVSGQPNPFYQGSGGHGVWVFKEIEICADTTTGGSGVGYWRVYVNGTRVINYAGRTDTFDAQDAVNRALTIGPCVYSGQYGPPNSTQNNFGYTADHYMDLTGNTVSGNVARVVFGNATTLAASTILALPFSYSSWGNTQIQCTFNHSAFASGSIVYGHVVTEGSGILDDQISFIAT